MKYVEFADLVNTAAALRVSARLRSVASAADAEEHWIFPSTYDGGRHAATPADEHGLHKHVVVDSRQSFANRIERTLGESGLLPDFVVNVDGVRLHLHDLPHRVYDAILRDSMLGGVAFPKTPLREQLSKAGVGDATALLRHAPLTLLLGGWDSHSGGGAGSAKFAQCLSIRVTGHDGYYAPAAAWRLCPLGIVKDAGPVWSDPATGAMTSDPIPDDKGKPTKGKKPSELGHGNAGNKDPDKAVVIDGVANKGMFIRSIELHGALSLTRLRRYRFPLKGRTDPNVDLKARTLLAAMGVFGIVETIAQGLDLRSGCELAPLSLEWFVVRGLEGDTPIAFTPESARALFEDAIREAGAVGLEWSTQPVELQAGDALRKVYRQSHAFDAGGQ